MTATALLAELRDLIEQARQHVAQAANSALTILHWKLGARIQREILQGQRAQYGEEILPTLLAKLVPDYGKGLSPPSCATWSGFCSKWAPGSASWRGRSASASAPTISISICCSITGTCAGWSPWN